MEYSKTITSYHDLILNRPLFLGAVQLSEKEIINFATQFDPLYFHINPQKAKESVFGSLVASGAHLFTKVHKEKWIPIFGSSVMAGLELNNWKFIEPVYPNQTINSYVTLTHLKVNSNKQTSVLKWLYEFKDATTQNLVQCLEMTILHQHKKA